jgi:hypothetical protein
MEQLRTRVHLSSPPVHQDRPRPPSGNRDPRSLTPDQLAEFAPDGTLEHHTVAALARLLWPKEHLGTCRRAQQAQDRVREIRSRLKSAGHHPNSADALIAAKFEKALEVTARAEVGDDYALVELGSDATLFGLKTELAFEQYLDDQIDRCVKRLLQLKTLKSLGVAPPPRVVEPQQAA